MGLFDDLAGKVVGAVEGSRGQEKGLAAGVMGLLTNPETGGLSGLVQAFKQQAWEILSRPGWARGPMPPLPRTRSKRSWEAM
jgi:hypothetical protein